jgi:hypothetical protein
VVSRKWTAGLVAGVVILAAVAIRPSSSVRTARFASQPVLSLTLSAPSGLGRLVKDVIAATQY